MNNLVNFLNDLLPGIAIGTIIGSVVTREYIRIKFEKAVKNGDIIYKEKIADNNQSDNDKKL